ncbi:hypothetical protein FXN61_24180 [Lentzea sp. PSKA42]|uniref:Excreted virulence factor EspC, type VII ESX diderm n=1 Tax=Lentzea indica TaxID=2604800 RepID=A0ABX1FL78_9PSEU|nr:hypothetical protein [Lentzea indica]NKE59736.1 hypothetical protein [Lentzea indica]
MTSGGIIGPNHPIQQRANELKGYHVVPRQLALAGDELKSTATILSGGVVNSLESTHLAEDDLGFLGKQEQAPAKYNDSMRDCVDHFNRLSKTLQAAGDVLNEVAAHYAAMDDSYYEKFGRMDDH